MHDKTNNINLKKAFPWNKDKLFTHLFEKNVNLILKMKGKGFFSNLQAKNNPKNKLKKNNWEEIEARYVIREQLNNAMVDLMHARIAHI